MPASSQSIELLLADGATWQPLMLVADGDSRSVDETLAASEEGSPFTEQLVPLVQEDWSGGVGVDYDTAPGVCTRVPGHAMPAGAVTSVQVPVGAGLTTTPLVAVEEFGADLFVAQQGAAATYGGRVIRSVGATGTGGGAFANTVFTNYGGLGYITAGEYIRDLIVFGDGAGVATLYASSSDINGLNGRLHKWVPGTPAWTSTAAGAFGAYGRNRMAKVNWTTPDGSKGDRLATISGRNTISYTLPNADPMLPGSWIEAAFTIETAHSLLELVGSRQHVYATAKDGLYDLQADGTAPNLTSYTQRMVQTGNGLASEYLDGYIYMSLGRGLDRIRVDQGAILQEIPGQCAPGWMTKVEQDVQGNVNAMCVDQGFLVAAVYNPTTTKSAIFWGKDRQILGVQTPNPLVWYGPEVHGVASYQINRIQTSALAGDLRLWICAQTAGNFPVLHWVSIPVAGSPLQDMLSTGAHRFAKGDGNGTFNPTCDLYGLPNTYGDKASKKSIYLHTTGSRGLSVINGADDGIGTKLVRYDRADPLPGSAAWGSGVNVLTSPTADLSPSSTVSGYKLQTRIAFVSPNGATAPTAGPRPAVLDSLRTLTWKTAPALGIRTLNIEYGSGVSSLTNSSGAAETFEPDAITANLLTLTTQDRTTLRDAWGKRWTVKVFQVLNRHETVVAAPGTGKRVQAQMRMAVIAGPLT